MAKFKTLIVPRRITSSMLLWTLQVQYVSRQISRWVSSEKRTPFHHFRVLLFWKWPQSSQNSIWSGISWGFLVATKLLRLRSLLRTWLICQGETSLRARILVLISLAVTKGSFLTSLLIFSLVSSVIFRFFVQVPGSFLRGTRWETSPGRSDQVPAAFESLNQLLSVVLGTFSH